MVPLGAAPAWYVGTISMDSSDAAASSDAADGVSRKEHGINDGSGHRCHQHPYTGIDDAAAKRIESLSALLSGTYGVADARLITALCALGEGESRLRCVFVP